MDPDVEALPKAELHVHLEGTARPELVRRVAKRNGLALPPELLDEEGEFAWDDFDGFLAAYDLAAGVMRTPEDYRDVTFEYLSACAAENAVYVEIIASPTHADAVGLPQAEHVAAIAQGIDDARAAHGVEGRIVASAVRHRGVEAAQDVARRVADHAHPYVVGLNLVGDETRYPAADYARAFAIAHEAGLGCTVHAGEHAGPESVRAALALPGVTRLSHGVRAEEDPALVDELAARGIVLEVCPTSNVALSVYGSYEDHPLRRLHDAGVKVTLGSDDPPYFRTTIGREYAVANEAFGFDAAMLRAVTDTALDAAFAPADVVDAVRARARARARD